MTVLPTGLWVRFPPCSCGRSLVTPPSSYGPEKFNSDEPLYLKLPMCLRAYAAQAAETDGYVHHFLDGAGRWMSVWLHPSFAAVKVNINSIKAIFP